MLRGGVRKEGAHAMGVSFFRLWRVPAWVQARKEQLDVGLGRITMGMTSTGTRLKAGEPVRRLLPSSREKMMS